MTKEEAIEKLKELSNEWSNHIYSEGVRKHIALDMAIESLEQQPSDDCVSRKELLKLYGNRAFELQKTHQTDKQLGINWCINTLNELPPVTPTRKKGKWIKSNIGGAKVCSVCQAHIGLSNFKYCPNCGAEMEREE